MAEPAKKLPPPKIKLTLAEKPAKEGGEEKNNIVDFNQYRRDLNKKKTADKKEMAIESGNETPKPRPGSASEYDKERAKTGGGPAAKEIRDTDREKGSEEEYAANKEAEMPATAKPPKTEKEIAEGKKQGAPQEGVSESAGLTGGTPSEGEEIKSQGADKQPAGQTAAPQKPPAAGGGETGTEDEEPEEKPQKPQSTFQQTQQRIDEQKKKVSASRDQAAKAREKYEKDLKQKSWKRILSGRQMKKRQKEGEKEKKQLAGMEKLLGAQMATGGALKFSWLNLIDTWGLSYLYIAFHFLNTYFAPWSNLFCKFGEEWLPKQARETGGEQAKGASKGLELAESGGCVLIGLFLFFIILAAVVLLVILGYAYMYPLKTLRELGPGISWEAIKCAGGYVFGVGSCAE